MFTSDNVKIKGFLQMARLLGFLESSASKEEKICEIKAAVATGLIDQEEAVELAVEYC